MHYRAQIRAAAVDRLSGLPLTDDRVFAARTRALEKGHAPTLLVYAREEQSDRGLDGQPGTLGRVLLLVIEGRTSTAFAPDDLLDDIAQQVEERMRDADLRGLVFDVTLMRTEIDAQADGERVIGSIRLGYSVRYNDPAEDD